MPGRPAASVPGSRPGAGPCCRCCGVGADGEADRAGGPMWRRSPWWPPPPPRHGVSWAGGWVSGPRAVVRPRSASRRGGLRPGGSGRRAWWPTGRSPCTRPRNGRGPRGWTGSTTPRRGGRTGPWRPRAGRRGRGGSRSLGRLGPAGCSRRGSGCPRPAGCVLGEDLDQPVPVGTVEAPLRRAGDAQRPAALLAERREGRVAGQAALGGHGISGPPGELRPAQAA